MAKITLTGFIFASQEAWNEKPEYSFATYERDLYSKDLVRVCPHEFTVEIPDGFDLRPGLVANLEREKKQLMAEFQARVTAIDNQIQKYLAIEA
jgi:hypothetical protein